MFPMTLKTARMSSPYWPGGFSHFFNGGYVVPISQEYLDYVLDQLSLFGPVQSRRMFGGAGLYRNAIFFGLIADDVLYFKVDDTNKADYLAAGSGPFRPFGTDSYVMGYYEVPVEILEDQEQLTEWAAKAFQVALAKKVERAKRPAAGAKRRAIKEKKNADSG